MVKVCFVNGSLRGEKASSLKFINDIRARLNDAEFSARSINVEAGTAEAYPLETFELMAEADAIVVVFPLFTYSLPGALIRLLEEFYSFAKTKGNACGNAKLYAVVNCGFPQASICEEAIRVIAHFCERMHFRYRFSIAIASGPVTAATSKVPFLNPGLKRAFALIVSDMKSNEAKQVKDRYFNPIIPRPIILRIKEHYERKMTVQVG